MIFVFIVAVAFTALIIFGSKPKKGEEEKRSPYDIMQAKNLVNYLIYIDVLILIFCFTILLWVIVAAFFGFFIVRQLNHSNLVKYFLAIAPNDVTNYQEIGFYSNNIPEIGADKDHEIHFIAKDADNKVFFPESSKPNDKYYITNVTFTPSFTTTQTVQGKSGSALAGALIAGPIGASIGASGKRKVTTETKEHTAKAYLEMLTDDCKTTFVLEIKCRNALYADLKARYQLSTIQLAQLMDKLKAQG